MTTTQSYLGCCGVSGRKVGSTDNVPPSNAVYHVAQGSQGHLKRLCYGFSGGPAFKLLSRPQNLFGVELCVVVGHAYNLSVSTLVHFVFAVIARCSKPEVVWIAARRVVARMKHVQAIFDGAVCHLKRHAMSRPNDGAVNSVLPVAATTRARPIPAPVIRFSDFIPKPLVAHADKDRCITLASQVVI